MEALVETMLIRMQIGQKKAHYRTYQIQTTRSKISGLKYSRLHYVRIMKTIRISFTLDFVNLNIGNLPMHNHMITLNSNTVLIKMTMNNNNNRERSMSGENKYL